MQRIDLISKLLSTASFSVRAYKIVIQFAVTHPTSSSFNHSGGGIISITPPTSSPTQHPTCDGHNVASFTPHAYTTIGGVGGGTVYGNNTRGPRCWIPCLDSPFIFHRAPHEMIVSVTTPREEGLRVVTSREDAVEGTRIHSLDLGLARGQQDAEYTCSNISRSRSIWAATQTVASVLHEPVPARCLSLAIGPFQFVVDPECFENEEVTEEEENEATTDGDGTKTVDTPTTEKKEEKTRKKGNGTKMRGLIRQVGTLVDGCVLFAAIAAFPVFLTVLHLNLQLRTYSGIFCTSSRKRVPPLGTRGVS